MSKRKDQLTPANYKAILTHLFDRIHTTGEEMKNDFPNLLRSAIETEAWTHFNDYEGKPFENLVDWLDYSYPNGASMGQGKNAISYKDALKLTEGHPEVHRVLATNAPKGGKKKAGVENGNLLAHFSKRGNKMAKPVLADRLAQEFPKFYDAYLRGDYRSIRAAAEAAGLVKPAKKPDPFQRLKSNWKKATKGQQQDFLKWLKSGEAEKK